MQVTASRARVLPAETGGPSRPVIRRAAGIRACAWAAAVDRAAAPCLAALRQPRARMAQRATASLLAGVAVGVRAVAWGLGCFVGLLVGCWQWAVWRPTSPPVAAPVVSPAGASPARASPAVTGPAVAAPASVDTHYTDASSGSSSSDPASVAGTSDAATSNPARVTARSTPRYDVMGWLRGVVGPARPTDGKDFFTDAVVLGRSTLSAALDKGDLDALKKAIVARPASLFEPDPHGDFPLVAALAGEDPFAPGLVLNAMVAAVKDPARHAGFYDVVAAAAQHLRDGFIGNADHRDAHLSSLRYGCLLAARERLGTAGLEKVWCQLARCIGPMDAVRKWVDLCTERVGLHPQSPAECDAQARLHVNVAGFVMASRLRIRLGADAVGRDMMPWDQLAARRTQQVAGLDRVLHLQRHGASAARQVQALHNVRWPSTHTPR